MLRLLSIIICLGLMKPSAVRDLWRKDRLHTLPFSASVMPGWRYEMLNSLLYMSDP